MQTEGRGCRDAETGEGQEVVGANVRDSGLPADSAVVLTIVPLVFRLWRHYETFPSSVSLSPSLFFDERVAQLFLRDLKVGKAQRCSLL